MKKFRHLCLFILINSLLFSQVSKYEEVSVLGEKVYFPKKTSEYLLELLDSKDTDSYYETAKVYISLHEFTAAEHFMKKYEEKSEDYIKIAELYHLMGNYKKEIEYIDIYLEDLKDNLERLKYCDYIVTLITDKNLEISEEKYILTKLDRLEVYSENPEKYYEYFLSQEWTAKEKNTIVDNIKRKNETDNIFQNILDSIASEKELEKVYFEKITSIGDRTGYFKYFEVMERNSTLNSFRNEFEKFHYMRYKKDLAADFYKDKLAYEYSLKGDNDALLELYAIEPDFKLMYNLALVNDKVFYEFILSRKKLGIPFGNIKVLLEMFDEKFPFSKYSSEILKLKLDYAESDDEKLELLNIYLEQNNSVEKNIDFILMKLKLLLAKNEKNLVETLVSELIFSSYEHRKLVDFYSKLLEDNGRVDELITNLFKLNDKSFYIEKSVEYSYAIDKRYEDILINYYYEKGEYQKLLDYKNNLTYEMYDTLLDSGWVEFLETALSKYSIEEEWIDKTEFKYFYFDNTYDYSDEEKVVQIFDKSKRTDAETYYLAKHYEVIGDFEKSAELLEELEKEYVLNEL